MVISMGMDTMCPELMDFDEHLPCVSGSLGLWHRLKLVCYHLFCK